MSNPFNIVYNMLLFAFIGVFFLIFFSILVYLDYKKDIHRWAVYERAMETRITVRLCGDKKRQ